MTLQIGAKVYKNVDKNQKYFPFLHLVLCREGGDSAICFPFPPPPQNLYNPKGRILQTTQGSKNKLPSFVSSLNPILSQ